MGTRRLISDLATAAVSGFVALAVMDLVTSRVYALASEADRQQESAVSPGVAYTVAAKKTAAYIGLSLSEAQASSLGSLYHYLMGLGWAPVYIALRRLTGMAALPAGLVTGLTLWAGFDEGMVPALGFSAPNRAYPLSTHVRGFLGHLTYGLSIMTSVEAIRLAERRWSAQPEWQA
jgi:uncharacterized membrane protein YagU involved in acid resistance